MIHEQPFQESVHDSLTANNVVKKVDANGSTVINHVNIHGKYVANGGGHIIRHSSLKVGSSLSRGCSNERPRLRKSVSFNLPLPAGSQCCMDGADLAFEIVKRASAGFVYSEAVAR
nr:hypothetical protein BaRGS_028820 [Batillaria attramentaria]